MGFLPNWLTADDSNDADDSCDHHHWGEYRVDYDSIHTNIALHGDMLEIRPRKTAECLHDGCNAKDGRMASKVYIPIAATVTSAREALEIENIIAEHYIEEEE